MGEHKNIIHNPNGKRFSKTLECLKRLKEPTKDVLMQLKPWRKGPFQWGAMWIDSEWKSDIKWDRLKGFHESLITGKCIADLGCGNGYYMFRALAYKPEFILGIDGNVLCYYQFLAIQEQEKSKKVSFLCARIESFIQTGCFVDTLFCMGVLYHRKEPLVFLKSLKKNLKKGGVLVLETLIVLGEEETVLNIEGRYAQMRNVYAIPTMTTLLKWLEKSGFNRVEVISINQTSSEEQRVTEWSGPVSLANFLDPKSKDITIEGYPAPLRAMLIARL